MGPCGLGRTLLYVATTNTTTTVSTFAVDIWHYALFVRNDDSDEEGRGYATGSLCYCVCVPDYYNSNQAISLKVSPSV